MKNDVIVGGRITIWGVYTIQLIRYAEDVGGENEACYLNMRRQYS